MLRNQGRPSTFGRSPATLPGHLAGRAPRNEGVQRADSREALVSDRGPRRAARPPRNQPEYETQDHTAPARRLTTPAISPAYPTYRPRDHLDLSPRHRPQRDHRCRPLTPSTDHHRDRRRDPLIRKRRTTARRPERGRSVVMLTSARSQQPREAAVSRVRPVWRRWRSQSAHAADFYSSRS
jgi:hypothetical protein